MDIGAHPGRALAVLAAAPVTGMLAGVGVAYLGEYGHWWSPDNVLVGAACGSVGVLAGLLAALLIVTMNQSAKTGRKYKRAGLPS